MRLFLLPFVALTLAAQTPESAPEATPAAAQTPIEMPVVAKPAPKEDAVLASVDGRIIRESQFELYLGVAYNDQQRMQIAMIEGARKQVMDQFLQVLLLEAKARREKLDQEKSFIDQRAFLEMDLLARALMVRDGETLKKQIDIKDEDVKAFFEKHPDRFMSKGSFSARHILIGLKGSPAMGDKGLTEEEAKAKIAKIQAELKAGKKLEELTKEYSDDPGSKDAGGLYENKSFGEFVPEFEEAVRKQTVGQVGEPVKTMHGYHLIQVEKMTAPAVPAFDEVKDKVKQAATMERQEQVYRAYLDKIKKEIPYAEGPDAAKLAPAKAPVKAAAKVAPKKKAAK